MLPKLEANQRLRELGRALGSLQTPIPVRGTADPRKTDRPDAVAVNAAQADVLLARVSALSSVVASTPAAQPWDDVDTFLATALTADLALLAANFRWLSFAFADRMRLARLALDEATAALEDAGGVPTAAPEPD